MKTLALLALIATAQSNFTYTDADRRLAVTAKEGQGSMITVKGELKGIHLELKGGVRISSSRQKFVLNANHVDADAVPGKGSKSPNEIQRALATGGVRFSQSANTRSTNLQCVTATYRTSGNAAIVDAKGSVRIQSFDSSKKQTMTATGGSGTATLDKDSKDGDGLREATLNGSVRVDVIDAAAKSAHLIFTGDKLTMKPRQIVLSGHAKFQGSQTGRFGNLGTVDSIVVNLNDRKEMTSFSFKSGGGK